MPLKPSSLAKSLLNFLDLAAWRPGGHDDHNFFSNFIEVQPLKDFYLEILIVWSTTQSLIQLKPFPISFGMFDTILLSIDSNISSVLLSLIII